MTVVRISTESTRPFGVNDVRSRDVVKYYLLEGGRASVLRNGVPCGRHFGCLSHVTHRCRGCGRIRGQNASLRGPRIYIPTEAARQR